MRLKEQLTDKMQNAVKSCGLFLQLYSIYGQILEDPFTKEIEALIPTEMDCRSQENYFLLLFTVCKVMYGY